MRLVSNKICTLIKDSTLSKQLAERWDLTSKDPEESYWNFFRRMILGRLSISMEQMIVPELEGVVSMVVPAHGDDLFLAKSGGRRIGKLGITDNKYQTFDLDGNGKVARSMVCGDHGFKFWACGEKTQGIRTGDNQGIIPLWECLPPLCRHSFFSNNFNPGLKKMAASNRSQPRV